MPPTSCASSVSGESAAAPFVDREAARAVEGLTLPPRGGPLVALPAPAFRYAALEGPPLGVRRW